MSTVIVALGAEKGLIDLDTESLLHHTLVVGQSGSGKSFFLARLLEELLLRTKARIVAIDPNGDLRRFCQPMPREIWEDSKNSSLFQKLNGIAKSHELTPLDSREAFSAAWNDRLFQYLIVKESRGQEFKTDNALFDRLMVHWEFLRDEQKFMLECLDPDATIKNKLGLAVRACTEYLNRLRDANELPDGYGLREVRDVAEQFLRRDISLLDFPYVKEFATEDWAMVYTRLEQLLDRYQVWYRDAAYQWHRGASNRRKTTDLCGYLGKPWSRVSPINVWDACILGLDSADPSDAMFCVNVALSRLWSNAKRAWLNALERPGESDNRVPTFIVIDEAHNFAPKEARDDVQRRVTDKLIQIAAEGRKYGLYLILATQRPRKLHTSLVLECENFGLMRVQSRLEQEFAAQEFGAVRELTEKMSDFKKGDVLLHGRWVGGSTVRGRVAHARTVVGGAGLPNGWDSSPPPNHPQRAPRASRVVDVPSGFGPVAAGGGLDPGAVAPVADGVAGPAAPLDASDDELATIRDRIVMEIKRIVGVSSAPVPMPSLAHQVRSAVGSEAITRTQWAGSQTFGEMLKQLQGQMGLSMSFLPPGAVWDPARHTGPSQGEAGGVS